MLICNKELFLTIEKDISLGYIQFITGTEKVGSGSSDSKPSSSDKPKSTETITHDASGERVGSGFSDSKPTSSGESESEVTTTQDKPNVEEGRISRRSYIPRAELQSEIAALNEDLTDSALGLDTDDDDGEETSSGTEGSSLVQTPKKTGSQRVELISDALGDIGKAAHAVNVERKSDIIHGLEKPAAETVTETGSADSSGSGELVSPKPEEAPSANRAATIKNLFNAIGDNVETETTKEKVHPAKETNQDANKRSQTVIK